MPKYGGKEIFSVGKRRKKKKKEEKRKKKVGENNGQLRFVRHHGSRTQARLDQNKSKS